MSDIGLHVVYFLFGNLSLSHWNCKVGCSDILNKSRRDLCRFLDDLDSGGSSTYDGYSFTSQVYTFRPQCRVVHASFELVHPLQIRNIRLERCSWSVWAPAASIQSSCSYYLLLNLSSKGLAFSLNSESPSPEPSTFSSQLADRMPYVIPRRPAPKKSPDTAKAVPCGRSTCKPTYRK